MKPGQLWQPQSANTHTHHVGLELSDLLVYFPHKRQGRSLVKSVTPVLGPGGTLHSHTGQEEKGWWLCPLSPPHISSGSFSRGTQLNSTTDPYHAQVGLFLPREWTGEVTPRTSVPGTTVSSGKQTHFLPAPSPSPLATERHPANPGPQPIKFFTLTKSRIAHQGPGLQVTELH